MQDPQAVFTASGTPATRGICPVCGTTLFRMGRTPAHDGLEPPPVEARKRSARQRSNARKGNLVIVESPAKARTVGRYLGRDYSVKASIGHVRDLLRSQLSVDVDNGFAPKYRVPNEKREVVKALKQDAARAENIYLATDPDREGEAIAWHLLEAAEIEPDRAKRVVFHEITKPAIEEAFSHPRSLDLDLVDAQQARRVLDRLVGYNISPLLWAKVRSRLSAGRVQSAALRLVVDREREIDAFQPREYWSIDAQLIQPDKPPAFLARLVRIDTEEPQLPNEAAVRPIVEDMRGAAYQVGEVKKGSRVRRPFAPFTTSTLQQSASRRLGFTARKTMAVAQQLYEGLDLNGEQSSGLITYMRTDSTQVSRQAQEEARRVIEERFGRDFLPDKPPLYRTRSSTAQEAHEAIRPTLPGRAPDSVRAFLTDDQFKLYQLIWNRFMASQMNPALYDTLSIEVEGKSAAHSYGLRLAASSLRFPGFLSVHADQRSEDNNSVSVEELPELNLAQLPDLVSGDPLTLLELDPEQHFTQPPPRYSEATLVKTLEENGIGRPSTYAPILSTLQRRGYVERIKRRLQPTEIGLVVNDLVVEHFPEVVDLGFTAKMEQELDEIAEGQRRWVDVVSEFYGPFSQDVQRAAELMPETKPEPEEIGRACPLCGNPLLIRHGRYGKFIGCSTFPTCRHTEPILELVGAPCPQDGGDLVKRRTRRGRVFYGCSNFPECDFTTWKRPSPVPCPVCGGLLVYEDKHQLKCLQCGAEVKEKDLPETEGELA
jgi:DNA topoisomerase-1